MRNTLETILKLTAVSLMMVFISACGSKGKKVVTVDESAEYKSATSLQPLKRSTVDSSSPSIATKEVSVVTNAYEEQEINEQPNGQPDNKSYDQSIEQNSLISTVVSASNGASRMEVSADFESAWVYLNNNLKTSDLTVFSRNKAAKRVAIGCNGIEAEADSVTKSRWSFFNKDKYQRSEYCALELLEKRGKVHVSVLNRSGVEVLSAFSEPVFKRILAK